MTTHLSLNGLTFELRSIVVCQDATEEFMISVDATLDVDGYFRIKRGADFSEGIVIMESRLIWKSAMSAKMTEKVWRAQRL